MSGQNVVKSLITPHDQILREVFNAQHSYFIDIYQREYKWTEKNVLTLLDDIEVRFSQHVRNKVHPKDIQADVLERFEPYFLNTYLTHTTSENTSIVDGQQRLTTLLLIFIKLYLILKEVGSEPVNEGKTFQSKVLEQLIFETDDFGTAARFKIFNPNREDAFRALVQGQVVQDKDETGRRIRENYEVISKYLDKFLASDGAGTYDLPKLTYYIEYLMDRISIVEIRIEKQDNVAMIFEVVNDRGLGLKPYEILKGKLIGGLPGKQKEKANEVWTALQEKYFATELRNTTEKTLDLDLFFRVFFRSKFADTEKEYERFEGDYHYEIYRNAKVRKYFGEFEDRDLLFKLITEDIRYFAELYYRIRTGYDNEFLIYNKLLDQNQQYLLLLSCIEKDDPDEKGKIIAVARKFDQIHVILRLLGEYDSNNFQRLVYPLNAEIRNRDVAMAMAACDQALISYLEGAGTIGAGKHSTARDLFEFERFKGIRNQWLNFSKYVLMRIDRKLGSTLNRPSFASTDLKELEGRFNRSGNKLYAMHLEHIFTQHAQNRALFTTNGIFDETAFQQTRNLLGMVLLLKDKHNLSSNDDIYSSKRDTYSKSSLIWNELMVGHVPSIDAQSLPSELNISDIPADANGVFPRDRVEERQRAIFSAIKWIWGTF